MANATDLVKKGTVRRTDEWIDRRSAAPGSSDVYYYPGAGVGVNAAGNLTKFDDTAATGLPPFAVPTSPYRLSASPATIHSMPPRLGQHTDEVLHEVLGLDASALAALRDQKII